MQTDLLNRPIKVGDTIITKNYGDCAIRTISTALKVNRASVTVNVFPYKWEYINGKWIRQPIESGKPMRRYGAECIIINEQLAYNREAFPEIYV